MAEHPHRKALHERHHKEKREMHTRHEREMRDLHQRHEDEIGADGAAPAAGAGTQPAE